MNHWARADTYHKLNEFGTVFSPIGWRAKGSKERKVGRMSDKAREAELWSRPKWKAEQERAAIDAEALAAQERALREEFGPSLCSHCGAEKIYAAGLCADCHEAWSEQFSE